VKAAGATPPGPVRPARAPATPPAWRTLIERALDHPALFYAVRFLLVGDQGPTKRRLRALLDARPGETVLDVCCGIGEFAGCVDAAYVGVDLNPRFVARARCAHRTRPDRRFTVGDATGLPFADGRFDRAMAVNCMHHFADDLGERVLREIRRVTRGPVLVVDIDGTPRGVVRRSLLAMDRGAHVRTPERLAALVRRVLDVEAEARWDVGLYTEVAFRCRGSARA
jgi:ubiquinone/menaquinone biosynthesis C-methylase UbiE